MPKTEDGLSFVAADVEVSQDGAAWTNMVQHGVSLATSGGDRGTGEVNVWDDEIPIIGAGKRASTDVTVRYVYTEINLDPFNVVRGWFEMVGGVCYLRYWPGGQVIGGYVFTTGKGILINFKYPEGEASDGAVILGEFTVKCEGLTKAIWAGS